MNWLLLISIQMRFFNGVMSLVWTWAERIIGGKLEFLTKFKSIRVNLEMLNFIVNKKKKVHLKSLSNNQQQLNRKSCIDKWQLIILLLSFGRVSLSGIFSISQMCVKDFYVGIWVATLHILFIECLGILFVSVNDKASYEYHQMRREAISRWISETEANAINSEIESNSFQVSQF